MIIVQLVLSVQQTFPPSGYVGQPTGYMFPLRNLFDLIVSLLPLNLIWYNYNFSVILPKHHMKFLHKLCCAANNL